MKFLMAAACMVLTSLWVQAQSVPTRSAFVEIGGPSLVYSFNYDFRFDKQDLNSWGLRVGAGGYKLSEDALLTVPVQVTRLLGNGRNYFEVGAGFTFINYTNTYTHYDYSNYDPNTGESPIIGRTTDKNYHFILDMGDTPAIVGTLNIGYRRIPENGGFTFRTNITPLFNAYGFWPLFAGVGLGYAF